MRRTTTIVAISAGIASAPLPAAAHGLGGRSDLPMPLSTFLVIAGMALVAAFLFVAMFWTEPRLQTGPSLREVVGAGPVATAERIGRVVGLAGLAVVTAGAFVGTGDGITLAVVLVWVLWWVALPTFASVAGNLYRFVDPWWWVDRFGRPGRGSNWGVWPAVGALWLVVWLELVWPLVDPLVTLDTTTVLGGAAIAFTGYLVVAVRAGVPAPLANPFAVSIRTISAGAPVGASATGAGYRGWLTALPVLPRWPGLTTFLVVAIGTVAYDGLSATPWWRSSFPWDTWWFATLALVAVPTVFGGLFWGASWVAARLAELSPVDVARSFAHALVPVLVAWFVAHYITLVLFEGQLVWSALMDPFARSGGADVAGISAWLSPAAVWWFQAAVTILGHVAAIVLVHDRALALFGERDAPAAEYAMLVLFVSLAIAALVVLAVA